MRVVIFVSAMNLLIILIAIAGCATQPIYVPLPTSHPASPYAMESPVAERSGVLGIHRSEMMTAHPDWQIPGIRDREMNAHAAGPVPKHTMHGHDKTGHDMTGHEMNHMNTDGAVKMEAEPDEVDYAPVKSDSIHEKHSTPAEHRPEHQLKSESEVDSKTDSGASLTPVKKMENMDHSGHEMPMTTEEPASPAKVEPESKATPTKTPGAHDMHGMHH